MRKLLDDLFFYEGLEFSKEELINLKELSLENYALKEKNFTEDFEKLVNLRKLTLYSVQQRFDFSNLPPNLKALVMKGAKSEYIEINVDLDFLSLKFFPDKIKLPKSLSLIQIEYFDKELFDFDLPNLKDLAIDDAPNLEILEYYPNLSNIKIMRSKIFKLNYYPQLKSLILPYSFLKHIEKLAKNIDYIDLRHNSLKTLPSINKHIKTLFLRGNDLHIFEDDENKQIYDRFPDHVRYDIKEKSLIGDL